MKNRYFIWILLFSFATTFFVGCEGTPSNEKILTNKLPMDEETKIRKIKIYNNFYKGNKIPLHAQKLKWKDSGAELYVNVTFSGDKGKSEGFRMLDPNFDTTIIPEDLYIELESREPSETKIYSTPHSCKEMKSGVIKVKIGNIEKEINVALTPKKGVAVVGKDFLDGLNYTIDLDGLSCTEYKGEYKRVIYFWEK